MRKESFYYRFLHLILFFLLPAYISAVAQEATLSLNYTNVPISKIFKDIEKQASVSIVYNTDDINPSRKVTLKTSNKNVSQTMDALLRGTNVVYSIVDNHIVLSSADKAASNKSHPITVKGNVKDAKGEPLIGVSILIKGSSNGTVTDLDGNFTLPSYNGDVLEISYVGYTTKYIPSSSKFLLIVLEEDNKMLEEVVVTALGIKRSQKALSYNVQKVGSEEINTVKDANFVNSLAGKVAGVNINASSSGTGGATRVVIRGTKSISSNNNALYVIDGIPLFNVNKGSTEGEYSSQPGGEGISDINPDDIESMSVLSGPAAAALYGANAAQGVILITTKKGRDDKISVTISNNTTFSSPFIMPDFQNTYSNRPGEFMSWGDKMEKASSFTPKDFFNTGSNIQNSIALSVGNNKNQTYLSVATTNSKGIILNNNYNRYNFTLRNTTKFLKDKMTLDAGINYVIQNDQNMMAQGEYWNPLIDIYLFPRGENFDDIRMFERYDEGRQIFVQHWPWGTRQNPYWIAKRNLRNNNKDRFMLNASLKYDITEWINVAGRIRIDNSYNNYEEKRYASTDGLFAGPKGFYKMVKSDEKQTYGDIISNINKNFGNFSLSATIGGSGSFISTNGEGLQGALKDMPNKFTYFNIDFKEGRDSYPLQDGWEESTISLFGSAELGWKNMLYLTVTGRNDWASALVNTEKSSFFYPSVGLSGIISEMVKLPKFISYLKIRGSWASVGSAIPRGLSQPRYKWNAGTGKWETNTFRPLGKLFPERTNSWEAGISARLWENRISLDATWYLSNTRNQTFNIPVSPSSGYSSMYVQSGNVRNMGMEISLGVNNKIGNLDWNSTVTFSFNNNKVVELLDNYYDEKTNENYSLTEFGAGGVGSLSYKLEKGGTMGDIYISKRLKRDQEGNIWIDPTTKNVVVENLNKPIKVGSVLPKSNLGFRNDFTYRMFNMGCLITGRFGGDVVSITQAVMDEYGVSKTSADVRDAGGIAVNKGTVSAESYYSKIVGKDGLIQNYIYSGTNIRMQEAHVGINLPAKWFDNKIKIGCSLVGRNLFMIYKKAPFDPEATASTGTYFQGLDLYMQPSLRSYGFNVNVQF